MENNKVIECLLCGSETKLKHQKYPGYQEPSTFRIYHCPSCYTAFSLPRVETTSIYENIYRNGKKVPGYDRYWEYAEKVKKHSNPLNYLASAENTYWAVKESLAKTVIDKVNTKVLEIGSGIGYLTYSLIKENYDVIGLDISETAVNNANKNFGKHYVCADLFEYSQLYPESFDVVILTEVIEHVDKPIDFIASILKLLKPGGHAIISTPNRSLYPNNTIWVSDIPPVHWWWLSENSMEYIAEKLDSTICFIDFSNYYSKNYQSIDMNKIQKKSLPKPYFNKNGGLIVEGGGQNKTISFKIRKLFSEIPYLKNTYHKLKDLFKKELIICKERGTVLCAILQKPETGKQNS